MVLAGTISFMHCRSWSSRFALCAAVCALLLKSAVPMLAAGAAQMRGVPVAEVCAVYGVALPGASHEEHAGHTHHHADPSGHGGQGSHSATAHIGDHCALTALAALAVPDQAALAVTPSHAAVLHLASAKCTPFRDACATWAARLKQGPPALA